MMVMIKKKKTKNITCKTSYKVHHMNIIKNNDDDNGIPI